jgi:peptide/nickel transport system substrate-binding protein
MSPTEWLVFVVFSILLSTSGLFIIGFLNFTLIEKVPAPGGTLSEGLIGTPRFINPLLASSDSDRSLNSLVYAGLLKFDSQGRIIPELAESYSVSPDQMTYTFRIKDTAVFHDGVRVTADDVIFTIERITDSRVQSFRQASWSGVAVEKMDERTVQFILTEPFGSFLRNATVGILPKHLWEEIEPAQTPFSALNIEPIGAGPYKIKSVQRRDSGIPISYSLEPFEDYVLGAPYISEISFNFYENEEELLNAYRDSEIESARAISSEDMESILREDSVVHEKSLPRVFGVFFNQNKNSALLEQSARDALATAINKQSIVSEQLHDRAKVAHSPIPPHIASEYGLDSPEEILSNNSGEARKILLDAGWEFDKDKNLWLLEKNDDIKELSIKLTTSSVPELKRVADAIAQSWREIGAQVDVEVEDSNEISEDIIRPRDYEALLFGTVVVEPIDLFAFWHSSQRNDPGLNLSLYTNINVDRSLRDIRETNEKEEIGESLEAIISEIEKDNPAVFLYVPNFIYITPKKIKGLEIGIISSTGDRFINVHEWYIETNREWAL